MTTSKTACAALLLMDTLAFPLLVGIAPTAPLVAFGCALLVMLIHPLLFWRLSSH
jgi:hypothetical protein